MILTVVMALRCMVYEVCMAHPGQLQPRDSMTSPGCRQQQSPQAAENVRPASSSPARGRHAARVAAGPSAREVLQLKRDIFEAWRETVVTSAAERARRNSVDGASELLAVFGAVHAEAMWTKPAWTLHRQHVTHCRDLPALSHCGGKANWCTGPHVAQTSNAVITDQYKMCRREGRGARGRGCRRWRS